MSHHPHPLKLITLSLLASVWLTGCGDQATSASATGTSAAQPIAKVEASSGLLRIVTDPGDAQIFINGQRKGNSPAEVGQSFAIKLGEASYTIEAIKPNDELSEYYGKKTDVFVANESLQTISLTLNERDTEAGKIAKEKAGAEKKKIAQDLFNKAYPSGAPDMVAIPAGRFRMGCVEGKDCRDNEKPVHTVQMAAFRMGKHEVTFDQWDACVADGGCTHQPDDKGWGRGKRPVINVSWDDIQTYLSWLNKKTGKQYRLPSEAEWEYAARAGTTTRFSTGDCITTAQANFFGNSPAEGCPKGEYREMTVEVGSFAANPWGLFDLHGNVGEWTQDCWNDSYSGAPVDASARSDGDCSLRGMRGSSWSGDGWGTRNAYRNDYSRVNRHIGLGFRLSRSN